MKRRDQIRPSGPVLVGFPGRGVPNGRANDEGEGGFALESCDES